MSVILTKRRSGGVDKSQLSLLITNEPADGLKNNHNRLFTTAHKYVVGTLSVYYNGQRLVEDYDYEEEGNNSFRLIYIQPSDDDGLVVDYQVSGSGGYLGSGGSGGGSGTGGTSGTSGTSGSSGTSGDGTSGTSGSSGTSGEGTSGTSGSSGSSGTSGVGAGGTSGTSGTSGSSGTSSEGGLTAVVQDITPELGGNLDFHNYTISGTGRIVTGNHSNVKGSYEVVNVMFGTEVPIINGVPEGTLYIVYTD